MVKTTEGSSCFCSASVKLATELVWVNWGNMRAGLAGLCKQDRHRRPESFLQPPPQESYRYEQSQQHTLVLSVTCHWRQSLQPEDDGSWQWCQVDSSLLCHFLLLGICNSMLLQSHLLTFHSALNPGERADITWTALCPPDSYTCLGGTYHFMKDLSVGRRLSALDSKFFAPGIFSVLDGINYLTYSRRRIVIVLGLLRSPCISGKLLFPPLPSKSKGCSLTLTCLCWYLQPTT